MSLKLYWRRRLPIVLGVAGLAVSGCVNPQQQAEEPANTRLERSLLDAAADSELHRDHNAALTYYRTLYRRDPNDAGVVVGLSRNLRRLNRANEANAIVLRAMKNNEKNGELIGELGKIQLAMGEPLKAVETLSRAEALTGNQWHLSGALAVAYDRIQMFDQAERAYRKALDLSPENADILNNMALSLALKGELDRAIDTLEHATALPEASGQMRQNLALLYAVRGDLESVERLVRRDLPRQIADENMSQYRRIADAAAVTSSRGGETGNAVAAALATPILVKPGPEPVLPGSPVATVETTPIEPAVQPASVKAMMADKAKDEPAIPASAAPEATMAKADAPAANPAMAMPAKESMAGKAPAATTAKAEKEAQPAKAASMPDARTDSGTETMAAPAADSGLAGRMAGARTTDEQLERASMAEAKRIGSKPVEPKPAELEPVAMAKPRPLTGAMSAKADAAAPKMAKTEMAEPAMSDPAKSEPAMSEPAEAAPVAAEKPMTADSESMAAGSAMADKAMADKAMAAMAKAKEAKADDASAGAVMAEKSMTAESKTELATADTAGPAEAEPAADATAEKAETMPAEAITTPVLLASTAPAGYRLQLGSFRSIDRANRLIRMLADDHGDLLQSTQLGVTEASIDGDRQVFRVMSDTMPDRGAATTLCDALKGRDLGCLMLRSP